MTEKRSGSNRFGWLTDEEDPRTEEALREEAPVASPVSAVSGPVDLPGVVPGVAQRVAQGSTRRRRRNRAKNPKALRNDPERMMAGARVRRDVRRRVDQALADPGVAGEGGMNYSLLVELLLVRWLGEVGYSLEDR
jgi:hypothetical protein